MSPWHYVIFLGSIKKYQLNIGFEIGKTPPRHLQLLYCSWTRNQYFYDSNIAAAVFSVFWMKIIETNIYSRQFSQWNSWVRYRFTKVYLTSSSNRKWPNFPKIKPVFTKKLNTKYLKFSLECPKMFNEIYRLSISIVSVKTKGFPHCCFCGDIEIINYWTTTFMLQ